MAILAGGVIYVFVGSLACKMVISAIAVGIFSAYMLYNLKQIVEGGETYDIGATLVLILYMINMLQRPLALLGIMGGERDGSIAILAEVA